MDKLDSIHWAPVVADRRMKLVKFDSDEDGFLICFTDLSRIFRCEQRVSEMLEMNQKLNDHLTVKSSQHLIGTVEDCVRAFCREEETSKTKVEEEVGEGISGDYKLQIRVKVGGVINFSWIFSARRGEPSTFLRHVMLPFVRTCASLRAQKQRMSTLLAAKDAEIEDMRLGGAKVSRKVLTTKKFVAKDDLKDDEEEEVALCLGEAWCLPQSGDAGENDVESREKKNPSLNGDEPSVVSENRKLTSEDRLRLAEKRSASSTSVLSSSSSTSTTSSTSLGGESSAMGAKEKAVKVRKKQLGF